MSVKSVALITVGVLSASTALSAEKKELHGNHSALILNEEGDLSWRPSIHGLNKYTISLPKEGITKALQYQDTSELFYLSEISEDALNISPNNRLWANLLLTPSLSTLNLNWPFTEISYGRLQLNYINAEKLSHSMSGHVIVSSTPYSFHDIALSFGNKIELSTMGAILNMGEGSERFYFASVSDSQINNYSISYGQRTWQTFGELDTAWIVGVNSGDQFASVQLERNLKNWFWSMQLTSQSGKKPRFGLSTQYNLNNTKSGSWSVMASSMKDWIFAPGRLTLATHRRRSLPNLWGTAVSIEAIRSVEQTR